MTPEQIISKVEEDEDLKESAPKIQYVKSVKKAIEHSTKNVFKLEKLLVKARQREEDSKALLETFKQTGECQGEQLQKVLNETIHPALLGTKDNIKASRIVRHFMKAWGNRQQNNYMVIPIIVVCLFMGSALGTLVTLLCAIMMPPYVATLIGGFVGIFLARSLFINSPT